MIDPARLAERLREAREAHGLSQKEVAAALDVPRSAVSKIESGRRAVSTLELTRMADLYALSASFFLSDDPEQRSEDLAHVLLRALPETREDPRIAHAVRSSVLLCREGASLRRLLDRAVEPTVPSYAARIGSTSEAIRQGEAVAREERRRLGLGDVPIRSVAGLIGDQGVWAAATALPDGLSGLFVNHPDVGFAVLVNGRHGEARRRFSYFHEYAHVLFDRDRTVTTSRRDNASGRLETRANAFAAAFLMPPGGVAEQLERMGKGRPSRNAQAIFDVANDAAITAEIRTRPGSQQLTYADVAGVARHFGVSFEAAVWRLKSLKHTSASESAALIEQKHIGNRYIRMLDRSPDHEERDRDAPEGVSVGSDRAGDDRELRGQLLRLAIEAFRREEISRGRLLEIGRRLDIAGDDMLDVAMAARPC